MNSTTRLTGRLLASGRALTGVGRSEFAAAALARALETFGAVIVPEGEGMGALRVGQLS